MSNRKNTSKDYWNDCKNAGCEAIVIGISVDNDDNPVESTTDYDGFKYYCISMDRFIDYYGHLMRYTKDGVKLSIKFMTRLRDDIRHNRITWSETYSVSRDLDPLIGDDYGEKGEVHLFGVFNNSRDLVDGQYLGCIPCQLKMYVGDSTNTANCH